MQRELPSMTQTFKDVVECKNVFGMAHAQIDSIGSR